MNHIQAIYAVDLDICDATSMHPEDITTIWNKLYKNIIAIMKNEKDS